MSFCEDDIAHENGSVWVLQDQEHGCYTVYVAGNMVSVSDSSYPLTEDGRSLAVARTDYLAQRRQATPH